MKITVEGKDFYAVRDAAVGILKTPPLVPEGDNWRVSFDRVQAEKGPIFYAIIDLYGD